ncbi:hypothetical protein [Natrinema sp. SYSU A 869]|uniref:hypothetical protein n=1 Tax=Natrinema sp. SYSU A 869 TaxID=2871694 RepID=UPI002106A014|nr:hypothetical protein [Natrinema sp. SYSU A 869]
MALFEDVDIVDDQHRRWRCHRLGDLLVEMILDGFVFPGTFANETSNAMFVDLKPFADPSQCLVTARADQAFNIRWSNTPRVCCS